MQTVWVFIKPTSAAGRGRWVGSGSVHISSLSPFIQESMIVVWLIALGHVTQKVRLKRSMQDVSWMLIFHQCTWP